jgi:hypothetical protein
MKKKKMVTKGFNHFFTPKCNKRICLNFWSYSDNITATPMTYKREKDVKIVAFYGYSERLAKGVPNFGIFLFGSYQVRKVPHHNMSHYEP